VFSELRRREAFDNWQHERLIWAALGELSGKKRAPELPANAKRRR